MYRQPGSTRLCRDRLRACRSSPTLENPARQPYSNPWYKLHQFGHITAVYPGRRAHCQLGLQRHQPGRHRIDFRTERCFLNLHLRRTRRQRRSGNHHQTRPLHRQSQGYATRAIRLLPTGIRRQMDHDEHPRTHTVRERNRPGHRTGLRTALTHQRQLAERDFQRPRTVAELRTLREPRHRTTELLRFGRILRPGRYCPELFLPPLQHACQCRSESQQLAEDRHKHDVCLRGSATGGRGRHGDLYADSRLALHAPLLEPVQQRRFAGIREQRHMDGYGTEPHRMDGKQPGKLQEIQSTLHRIRRHHPDTEPDRTHTVRRGLLALHHFHAVVPKLCHQQRTGYRRTQLGGCAEAERDGHRQLSLGTERRPLFQLHAGARGHGLPVQRFPSGNERTVQRLPYEHQLRYARLFLGRHHQCILLPLVLPSRRI